MSRAGFTPRSFMPTTTRPSPTTDPPTVLPSTTTPVTTTVQVVTATTTNSANQYGRYLGVGETVVIVVIVVGVVIIVIYVIRLIFKSSPGEVSRVDVNTHHTNEEKKTKGVSRRKLEEHTDAVINGKPFKEASLSEQVEVVRSFASSNSSRDRGLGLAAKAKRPLKHADVEQGEVETLAESNLLEI